MEQLKLLVVDEDQNWATKAQRYFQDRDYAVLVCPFGKEAQLAVYNNKIFAVLLNFSVKNHSSIQVLKYIKLNYTGVKVIITLNQRSLLEEQGITAENLLELGASDVIVRSEDWDKIRGVIETYQSMSQIIGQSKLRDGASAEVEVSGNDAAFTSVKIDEFYSGQAMLFDVYVQLSSGKYIKILHAGDSFDQARVDKYKSKGISHLHFSNNDRLRYIRLSNFIAKKMMKNENIPTETKMALTKNIVQKFVEEIYTADFGAQAVLQATEISQNMFSMLEGEKDLYKFLREQMEMDPTQHTHSFLVGLYSCLVCKHFEWDSPVTRETLSLASMLHDIGKSKLDKSLLNKNVAQMTPAELAEYSKHPALGAEIIRANKKINPTVAQIVMQHHELCDGSGFPFGLKRGRIATLSRLVSFTNAFADYIVQNKINPMEGVKSFLKFPGVTEKYDGMVIEKFCLSFVNPIKVNSKGQLKAG